MDLSENIACRFVREVQSFHWNQKQATIHPMMLYYVKNGILQKEGFIPITDDLKHDANAEEAFEKAAVDHLRNKGIVVEVIH